MFPKPNFSANLRGGEGEPKAKMKPHLKEPGHNVMGIQMEPSEN